MEDWQLDFEWLQVQHQVQQMMGYRDLPDLNGMLFLIGIQCLGRIEPSFSKEEKQDLMHIAVCELLSRQGSYEYVGRDVDGWPHYRQLKAVQTTGQEAQERLLRTLIIQYFNEMNEE